MSDFATLTQDQEPWAPGTRVEIRSTFDRRWKRGFEVHESTEKGYSVVRLSDRAVLPAEFLRDDVRRERRDGLWWF